ncbi:E3 ubiquitin-protein ligase TRIM69 isoform 2-T2 [Spinachia spinachia]
MSCAECVQFSLQETLQKQRECLKRQKEAVKYRLKKLAARQSEITKKSSVIRESIVQKYQEIKAVLDEDLRRTLSHLEMEEQAAFSALDGLMEKNCSLIQEIEQDLARFTVSMDETDIEPDTMDIGTLVMDTLNNMDPSSVSLDEVKFNQILSLTENTLLLISSQTPIIKKLTQSCQFSQYFGSVPHHNFPSLLVASCAKIVKYVSPDSSEVCLDPRTAHPKLVISPQGDSATYTDTWQQLPDLPQRFDTTLNVMSSQGFSCGRHYWEIDVTGKTYWELGVTYPNIPRKGPTEDCWLGRGGESWCVELFDGEYTAWHGGVPHKLLLTKRFCRIGVLCSYPAGSVTFLEADNMTPLFSFCVGTFSDRLHLVLCPGHDHCGTNAEPLVICNVLSPSCDL